MRKKIIIFQQKKKKRKYRTNLKPAAFLSILLTILQCFVILQTWFTTNPRKLSKSIVYQSRYFEEILKIILSISQEQQPEEATASKITSLTIEINHHQR